MKYIVVAKDSKEIDKFAWKEFDAQEYALEQSLKNKKEYVVYEAVGTATPKDSIWVPSVYDKN